MEISKQRLGGLIVLRPKGRIDNATSAEFQAQLLAEINAESGDIVIDFAAVEYISSAGLRALMTAARMKAKERRLAATGLNAVVQEIFTISRFHLVFACFDTVREAIGKLDPPALSAYDQP